MKRNLKIFIATLILVAIVFYDYSIYDEMIQNDTETSVFVDITDRNTSQITGEQIIEYTGISRHTWSSHTVWVNAVTNFTFESTSKMHVDKEYILLANPFKRDRKMKQLIQQLDSSIIALYAKDGIINKSCIYEPIMRELNRMSMSTSHHRSMIIHSDLGENSDLFSVFRSADIRELNQHPEKIIDRFENKLRPENLKGIDIFFVYKCKNNEDNRRYILMLNIMRKILSDHGANVANGASLIRRN